MTRSNRNGGRRDGTAVLGLMLVISVLMGVGLYVWSTSVVELDRARDLYWQLWALGIIAIGAGFVTKGKVINSLSPKATPPIVVASLVLGWLVTQLEPMLPFSIFSMPFSISSLEVAPYVALFLFGVVAAGIEEHSAFGSWMPSTFANIFQGRRGLNPIFVAVILTGILSAWFHVILGAKIVMAFFVVHFAFRVIVTMINLLTGSYIPSLIIHSFRNSAVVGVLFSLPLHVWLLPPLVISGMVIFLSMRNSR